MGKKDLERAVRHGRVARRWSGSRLTGTADVRADTAVCGTSDVSGVSKIAQITEDHTYGNLVADASGVPNLPERISRFLDGRADGRSPDLTSRELHSGDRFLLCSDGLSSAVSDELIQDALRSSKDPEEAADHLIRLAIDHGGPGNITVIVIDVRSVR
ncbi:PP2C family protein-serine/threonine phosphatase [Streptosporangium sp. CA-135522]|uniref:PP2C family protein-serine/threonine phosphatase n=1 Tax=Streptosporangium sp. CA-135522 TaxID=3240072 RepID=UPI003D927182